MSSRRMLAQGQGELEEARRLYDRERKLPKELVEELAKTTSRAQEAWAKARKARYAPAEKRPAPSAR